MYIKKMAARNKKCYDFLRENDVFCKWNESQTTTERPQAERSRLKKLSLAYHPDKKGTNQDYQNFNSCLEERSCYDPGWPKFDRQVLKRYCHNIYKRGNADPSQVAQECRELKGDWTQLTTEETISPVERINAWTVQAQQIRADAKREFDIAQLTFDQSIWARKTRIDHLKRAQSIFTAAHNQGVVTPAEINFIKTTFPSLDETCWFRPKRKNTKRQPGQAGQAGQAGQVSQNANTNIDEKVIVGDALQRYVLREQYPTQRAQNILTVGLDQIPILEYLVSRRDAPTSSASTTSTKQPTKLAVSAAVQTDIDQLRAVAARNIRSLQLFNYRSRVIDIRNELLYLTSIPGSQQTPAQVKRLADLRRELASILSLLQSSTASQQSQFSAAQSSLITVASTVPALNVNRAAELAEQSRYISNPLLNNALLVSNLATDLNVPSYPLPRLPDLPSQFR